MRFKSKAKRIHISRLGRTVEFKRGYYSTGDPREIAVLRSHPLVEEAPARKVEPKPEPAEEYEPVVVTVDENGEILGEEPFEGQ